VIAHRRANRRPEQNEYDLILEMSEKLGKLERALSEEREHGERRAGDSALQIATVALRLYEWFAGETAGPATRWCLVCETAYSAMRRP
jgi:hypothetical protein